MRLVKALLLVITLAGVLAGCRQSAQPTDTANLDIQLEVGTPFVVGATELIITIKDAEGQPVDNATVEVTGDMTHAGMKPVAGMIQQSQQGRYHVPFEWTMGGDWIVTVKVTLPDGRTSNQRFDVAVTS